MPAAGAKQLGLHCTERLRLLRRAVGAVGHRLEPDGERRDRQRHRVVGVVLQRKAVLEEQTLVGERLAAAVIGQHLFAGGEVAYGGEHDVALGERRRCVADRRGRAAAGVVCEVDHRQEARSVARRTGCAAHAVGA